MSSLAVLPPTTRVKVYAGDDTEVGFRFSEAGVPKDVTGTHDAQIRAAAASPAALASWTIDVARAAEGILVLALSSSVSSVLPANTILAWDLQWTGSDAKTKTLMKGTLFVELDVTR